MALAKYFEDNMEIWTERNRYRDTQTLRYSAPQSYRHTALRRDNPSLKARQTASAQTTGRGGAYYVACRNGD